MRASDSGSSGGSPPHFVAGGDSGSSDEERDPHQTLIVDKALRRRAQDAGVAPAQRDGGGDGLVVHYVEDADGVEAAALAAADARTPAAATRRSGAALREGTPDGGAGVAEEVWVGESEEMRRLLRAPRYFDDDFEAAAQRCFRCGASGHRDRDCSAPPRERPCFLCGLFGHVSRDCPNGLCFNCAAAGHQSRDCPEPRGAAAARARCLRCGSRSHAAPACDRDYDAADLAAVTCYVCGEGGHLCCAPPPAQPPEPSCFRCGGGGHFGYECTVRFVPGGGGGAGAGVECFRCGGRGHFARECPAALSRTGNPTNGMGFGGGGGGGQQQRWQAEAERERYVGRADGGRQVTWQQPQQQQQHPPRGEHGGSERKRRRWEEEEEEEEEERRRSSSKHRRSGERERDTPRGSHRRFND